MLRINFYTKRSLILIIALVAIINTSFCQSYIHSPNDTIIANAIYNDVSVFNIIQLHPTNDTLYFKWNKQSESLPSSWEASICDNGHCNTTLVDSGAMDPVYIGDVGIMSLHINPHFQPGTAIIRYSIYDTNTPSQVDTLTWIISSIPTSINTLAYNKPTITFFNQTLKLSDIDNRFNLITVFDIFGRSLFKALISNTNEQYYLPQLPTSIMIIQLSGKNIIHKQKLISITQ